MAVKHEIVHHNGAYFITFTCYGWLPLFEITNGYNLVYKWFDVLVNKGNRIIGYVIMPNHVHAIIAFREDKQSINTRIGNGKRFIAYGLIDLLTEAGNIAILDKLASGVEPSDALRGKKHEVFEPSFDCKECRSDKFLVQKLDYIHANPCRGKWNLVDIYENYPHSSARFYNWGEHFGYKQLTHYRFLEDDLRKPL